MELSLLCDTNVMLTIVDRNDKPTIYCSSKNINNFVMKYLSHPEKAKEVITNEDVCSL